MQKQTPWELKNARIVKSDGSCLSGSLLVDGYLIPPAGAEAAPAFKLDLRGAYVFPALINSHDSLVETYPVFPGSTKRPYKSWDAYQQELRTLPRSRERELLSAEQTYLLGAYKSLVNGVTFVIDHAPPSIRAPFHKTLPVDLLQSFGIAHSAVSYRLPWGNGIHAEYTMAASIDRPFIVRIAEGFDSESKQSLDRLDREGGLGALTVLVHGLSLSDDDFDRIARAGAAIVWCPSANMHLYGQTLRLAAALSRGIPVCIGTDSTLTGSRGMLRELSAAMALWKDVMPGPPDARRVFSMATEVPARVFRLPKRGAIAPGRHADFFVLSPGMNDPVTTLVSSSLADVQLVVKNGLPVFGDDTPEMAEACLQTGVQIDHLQLQTGERKICTRGLRAVLDDVSRTLGAPASLDFLPFV